MPENWGEIRKWLHIVTRARLRIVCHTLHKLDSTEELSPAWTRDHPDLPSLDDTCRGFWRYMCKEMALLDWPMPEPHKIVPKEKGIRIHELCVRWTRDDKTIRLFDGLSVYTSDRAHGLYAWYKPVSSTVEENGDIEIGPDYISTLEDVLHGSILLRGCFACHKLTAVWEERDTEYGYCINCCIPIASTTRNNCPDCAAIAHNPAADDTDGFRWCTMHGFHHRLLNK